MVEIAAAAHGPDADDGVETQLVAGEVVDEAGAAAEQ